MQELVLKGSGARLRYHDFPGEGTPLLFIHGLGCAGSFDYPQVAAQPELCGHRRILVDLLGAGFSDKPDDFPYTIDAHVQCLLELVDQLGFSRFIPFGHSFGGTVALALAHRCPERLEQVILSEPTLRDGGPTVRQIVGFGPDEFIADGFRQLVEGSLQEGNTMWAATLSVWSPRAVYLRSQSQIEGQQPSPREVLYALECPRTYIFGERSLPSQEMQALLDHGIHVEVVSDAGHSMAWENPHGLAVAIRNGIESAASL